MKKSLKIATYLAPNLFPVYKFISDYLGQALNIQTDLSTGRTYKQINRGEFDICFVCGLPYVLLTRNASDLIEPIAAPVLKGKRYKDRPIYFSDVIAQRGAPWSSFEELSGRSWAFNEPKSQSGYGITLSKLLAMGKTSGFFGSVIRSGYHQKSIALVADGKADASAIDSQLLAVEMRENPHLKERLKIIDTLGPSTIQPVVVDSKMSLGLKNEIQTILTGMKNNPETAPMFEFGYIDRFVPVDDNSYGDIRDMWSACEKSGFTRLA